MTNVFVFILFQNNLTSRSGHSEDSALLDYDEWMSCCISATPDWRVWAHDTIKVVHALRLVWSMVIHVICACQASNPTWYSAYLQHSEREVCLTSREKISLFLILEHSVNKMKKIRISSHRTKGPSSYFQWQPGLTEEWNRVWWRFCSVSMLSRTPLD